MKQHTHQFMKEFYSYVFTTCVFNFRIWTDSGKIRTFGCGFGIRNNTTHIPLF